MAGSPVDADAFNAFEAQRWETTAAGYDAFFGGVTPRVVDPLLDAVGAGPGVRLLDVASGPGYLAARAAERGASPVGVDIAGAMVALASRLHPNVEFRRGDVEALAFRTDAFDAAAGAFLLHHLGRPEKAVREMGRVVRPGGRIGLTVWDLPDRARFLGVLLDAVREAGASPPEDLPAGPDFFRFSRPGQLTGLLEGQGLEDVEVRDVAFELGVSSPDRLWQGLLGGTVRTAALVAGQPRDVRRRIRAAFDRLSEAYRAGDHFAYPVSVKLGCGRVGEARPAPSAGDGP